MHITRVLLWLNHKWATDCQLAALYANKYGAKHSAEKKTKHAMWFSVNILKLEKLENMRSVILLEHSGCTLPLKGL